MSDSPLMHGFPPDPDGQVTLANWRRPPFNRWSFQHVREIVPSADIVNRSDDVWDLPEAPEDLGARRLDIGGTGMTLREALERTDTDGFVVAHRGRLIHAYYAHGMTRDTPHILMSVSKSVLGLVVGVLADQRALDADAAVTSIIPEVAGTAYDGARVRDLLDMRAGILFDENYLAASGAIIEYRKAQGWDPYGPGETPSDLRSFFRTLGQRDGSHADRFHYVSPNTDLLGWVIERSTGRRYADLVSELLWTPLGARRSAYITVDRLGAPRCAGGMCATTEDLARLGMLVARGGARDGRQIVPRAWIEDIRDNGSRDAWDRGDFAAYLPGYPVGYRSKWYTLDDPHKLSFGIGVFGQNVFVDFDRDLVIAKTSSQALPMDNARILLTTQAIEALRATFPVG